MSHLIADGQDLSGVRFREWRVHVGKKSGI